MSTPPPAGDDLETVARALCKASGEHWFGSDRFQKDNGKWTLLARAALEAVRSTREGEIERLRKFAEWCVSDDFDSRDLDIRALEALNTSSPNGS